jgi:methionyl-tRNA formyltransferase
MSEAGAALVVDTLVRLERGDITPVPQDSAAATYAPILQKEHGRIDWSHSATEIYNRMRGFAPWPGAFTSFRGGLCQLWGHPAQHEAANSTAAPVLRGAVPNHAVPNEAVPSTAGDALPGTILAVSGSVYVECGAGTRLTLTSVQLEGRKRITAREFLNGTRPTPGERFGA